MTCTVCSGKLSDHDLATLDSAEGVPVRYRRDRLTVHTDDGPSPAWVYIDHRVTPGPPRPGYLQRIIDGAVHHGLPQRWIDFLHRWDPAHWPQPLSPSGLGPQSLSALLSEPGVVEVQSAAVALRLPCHPRRRTGTDDGCDRRTRRRGRGGVGVPAAASRPVPASSAVGPFRPEESPRLAEFLDHVDVAVSLHGYGRIGRSTQLLAGGRNRLLAAHLARHIKLPGYQVVTDLEAIPHELRGLHPDNPVNRVRDGGTQLELSVRVRGLSPRSPLPGRDGWSPVTVALAQGLAAAARSW